MGTYQDELIEHLSAYAVNELALENRGSFRGREYPHILPQEHRELNLLEPFRQPVLAHLRKMGAVRLHECFHHLNSSQAFAFNLFYPYFSNPNAAPLLAEALGEEGEITALQFEAVLDEAEGTNVDVVWQRNTGTGAAATYCEVKLSEGSFGTTAADDAHRAKLASIYAPRLRGAVAPALLEEKAFFRSYQILRNLALLQGSTTSRVLFLFPRRNVAVSKGLDQVLSHVSGDLRSRVRVCHVEDVLAKLITDQRADDVYRDYANALARKYLVAD